MPQQKLVGPLLGDVATIENGTTPGQVSHYNSQRTVSVVANVAGSDLGAASLRNEVETGYELAAGASVLRAKVSAMACRTKGDGSSSSIRSAPSAASRRAVRHGNLDGNAPDLVRVTGVSETIAGARKSDSTLVPSFLTG